MTEKNVDAMMPLHERALGLGAEIRLRRRRYAEAEELARRSLAFTEKRLGPDHTHVAGRLVLLAEVLRDAKRYAQAEPLYERAISIRRKVQAPEHPDLIKALGSYAELLRRTGRAAEAAE